MGIDPVRYEVFLHRLWAIGEEGRQTLQRVTASPIVALGGEEDLMDIRVAGNGEA